MKHYPLQFVPNPRELTFTTLSVDTRKELVDRCFEHDVQFDIKFKTIDDFNKMTNRMSELTREFVASLPKQENGQLLPTVETQLLSHPVPVPPTPPIPKDEELENFALHRIKICRECDRYKAFFCKECGCFMPAKTRMKNQRCPLGKWKEIED